MPRPQIELDYAPRATVQDRPTQPLHAIFVEYLMCAAAAFVMTAIVVAYFLLVRVMNAD